MTLVHLLKTLLPEELTSLLTFEEHASVNRVEVRYDDHTTLGDIRIKHGLFHLHCTVDFYFADESLSLLGFHARNIFRDCCGKLRWVEWKFRQIGFNPYWKWNLKGGPLLRRLELKMVCSSIDEVATALTEAHALGVIHTVELHPTFFAAKVIKALRGEYSVRWQDSINSLQFYDRHGHKVATYLHDKESGQRFAGFSWVIAEWDIENPDESSQAQEDMFAYVEDFLQKFDGESDFELGDVVDISDDPNQVALEVHCTATCESVRDLKTILKERTRILQESCAPDWIP